MFKVISDIIAQWYDMEMNTIIIVIYFFNGNKMICSLMFITSTHYGIKCLSNRILQQTCSDMFKVISGIMEHGMICEIQLSIQLISAMQRK